MRRHPETGLMSITLILLYLFGSMLVVTLGAGAYSALRAQSDVSDAKRMSIGYVAAKIRSSDSAGRITIERRNGIEALVLTEEGYEDCETLLYVYDGSLREIYQLIGSDIEPEYGTVLAEVNSFDFGFRGDRFELNAIYADGEAVSLTVALRTGDR